MRVDSADGAVHKWTGERWPDDVDVYQNHPGRRHAVLEYRDGAYLDSPLLSWQQQWLYIIYPEVLAVVRYVAPQDLGNRLPLGINCEALAWAEPVSTARLCQIERRATRQLDELLSTRNHLGRTVAA